jgi:hypothetical protein
MYKELALSIMLKAPKTIRGISLTVSQDSILPSQFKSIFLLQLVADPVSAKLIRSSDILNLKLN